MYRGCTQEKVLVGVEGSVCQSALDTVEATIASEPEVDPRGQTLNRLQRLYGGGGNVQLYTGKVILRTIECINQF